MYSADKKGYLCFRWLTSPSTIFQAYMGKNSFKIGLIKQFSGYVNLHTEINKNAKI